MADRIQMDRLTGFYGTNTGDRWALGKSLSFDDAFRLTAQLKMQGNPVKVFEAKYNVQG